MTRAPTIIEYCLAVVCGVALSVFVIYPLLDRMGWRRSQLVPAAGGETSNSHTTRLPASCGISMNDGAVRTVPVDMRPVRADLLTAALGDAGSTPACRYELIEPEGSSSDAGTHSTEATMQGMEGAVQPAAGRSRAIVPHVSPAALLRAIRRVESGGNDRCIGDGGRSRGPMQIGLAYWLDSGGRQSDYLRNVWSVRESERAVVRYWQRYCPAALRSLDCETLARIHNGGLHGARRASTQTYWHRVRLSMERQK